MKAASYGVTSYYSLFFHLWKGVFIIIDILLPQQPTCPVILIDTILSTTTFAKIAELTESIKRQKETIIINQLPVAPYLKKADTYF